MTNYQHIEIEQRGAVRWLWLNRPEVRNAFNDALVAEIAAAFADVEASPETRVVVVAARGPAFCAGADLNWMRVDGGLQPRRQPCRRAQGGAHVPRRAFLLAAGHRARAGRCLRWRRRPRGRLRHRGRRRSRAASRCRKCKLGIVAATISPHLVRAMGARAGRALHAHRRKILRGAGARRSAWCTKSR